MVDETMYGSAIVLPKAIIDAEKELDTDAVNEEGSTNSPSGTVEKTIWETPILDRSKLREHLNTLVKNNFEIFEILNIDRTTVQVICYKILHVAVEDHSS